VALLISFRHIKPPEESARPVAPNPAKEMSREE